MEDVRVPSALPVEQPLPRESLYSSNEREPLLPPTKPRYKPAKWQPHSPVAIVVLLYSVITLLQFGAKLMYVPSVRIFEWIICHHYYENVEGDKRIGRDGNVPESMCKIEPVQGRLNNLLAVVWMANCVPALMTTVFYGSLADRIGRRPVFALALTGLILGAMWDITVMAAWKVLPVEAAWASPVFSFIGGGESVANMMFFAIANDVTTEANRSNVFLLGGVGALLAEIIAPSLAAFLMLTSPWLPLLIGMSCLVVGTSLIIFVPETLHMREDRQNDATRDDAELSPAPKIDNSTVLNATRSRVRNVYFRIHNSTKMLHSLPALLLLITFVVGPFHRVGSDMFLRYISTTMKWPLREVGYLLSLKAFFNLLLVAVILPGAAYILTTYFAFTTRSKDLLLAEISIILLTVGVIIMSTAHYLTVGIIGMIIWTFGTGYVPLARSMMTTLIDTKHVGRLFAIVAMIEIFCGMAAAPILTTLYNIGLRSSSWHGLPYFALGIIFGLAGISLFGFAILKRKEFAQGDIRLEDDEQDTS